MAAEASQGLLLHVHLFKCAGTTVEEILQGSLGNRWMAIEPDHPGEWVPWAEIERQVLCSGIVDAVSSHAPGLTADEWRSDRLHTIIFVRHPIDRIHSAYEFERRQAESRPAPSARRAATMTFSGWVEEQLEAESHQVSNFACARLRPYSDAACERRRPANLDDLAFARETLDRAEVAGATDDCTSVWERYSRTLRGAWVDRRLTATWSNSLHIEGQPPSVDRRLAGARERLGARLYDTLLACNEHDLTLYEHARSMRQPNLSKLSRTPDLRHQKPRQIRDQRYAGELERVRLEEQLRAAITSRTSLLEQRSIAKARIADLEGEVAEARAEINRRDEQYRTSKVLRAVWMIWKASDKARSARSRRPIRPVESCDTTNAIGDSRADKVRNL